LRSPLRGDRYKKLYILKRTCGGLGDLPAMQVKVQVGSYAHLG
jgi:hypothetical protein